MAEKEPSPRNVKRLQSLEADLKVLRESSEGLVAERNELKKRLAEAESALEKARGEEGTSPEDIKEATDAFEKLIESGLITRPKKGGLPAIILGLSARVADLSVQLEAAQKQIAQLEESRKQLEEKLVASEAALHTAQENQKQLEEKLAAGEAALRDALASIRDLQNQINTRVAESEKRVAELEAELAAARKSLSALEGNDQTISQLLEENQRLSAQIETMNSDLTAVMNAAAEAKAGLEAARTETETRIRAELGVEIQRIQTERDLLQTQLNTANKQLIEEGKTPLLPADKVAVMINDLVVKMQDNLGGLSIRDGELKLKVGFGGIGETTGFVIPTTDTTADIRENLQEVTFRFDRTLTQEIRLPGT